MALSALPLIIGGGMSLAGLLGRKGGDGGAQKYLQMAMDEFGRLRPPTPEEMEVQLNELVMQGQITPEEAQVISQDPSAFLNIEENPVVAKAQMQALQKLQGIADAGGLDAQGKARLMDVINEFETSARGANEAIMENAAQRGIGGSGLELANRLVGTQESAGRASRNAVDVAAEAERRALDAIMESGRLSGDIRGQDYRVAADKAAAIDAINNFNTRNRQDVLNRNVDTRNEAQRLNLAERQRIADANTLMTNQNRLRNSDLKQTDFDNKYRIAAGKAGINTAQADAAAKKKAADDAFWANLTGTGGTILGAARWPTAATPQTTNKVATVSGSPVAVAPDDEWLRRTRGV